MRVLMMSLGILLWIISIRLVWLDVAMSIRNESAKEL